MQSCLKCNYQWQERPDGHKSKKCPRCNRRDWDKPRIWIKNLDAAPINIEQKEDGSW